MKTPTLLVVALLALAPVAAPSLALAETEPMCTNQPQANWMSQQAMQAKIAEMGYQVKSLQMTGNCYEMYGWDDRGRRAEIYFNPVTGDVVESEID